MDRESQLLEVIEKMFICGDITLKLEKSKFKVITNEIANNYINSLESKERTEFKKTFDKVMQAIRVFLKDDTQLWSNDDKYIRIAKATVENIHGIKDKMLIVKGQNSILNNFDYEILTKRDKNQLNNIEAFTALLNFQVENEKKENIYVEVSKYEIIEMIEKLNIIFEQIESLGG